MDAEWVMDGDDAIVLRRWVTKRLTIFPQSPFLFLNEEGGSLNAKSISAMIGRLSVSAGYGLRFFTSRSFRMGYAHLEAARVFSGMYSGGTTYQDVVDRITDGRLWSRHGKGCDPYVNQNLRNFFLAGRGMTLNEFLDQGPELLHDLSSIAATKRRPVTFFHHPNTRLAGICSSIGVRFSFRQNKCRFNIGQKLMQTSREFRLFVADCRRQRPVGKTVQRLLSDIVGCLLEDEFIDLGRIILEPFRSDLLNAVTITRYSEHESELRWKTTRSRKVIVHPLKSRAHSERILKYLERRKMDNKVHLGVLPDGQTRLLKVHASERHCIEPVAIPAFNLDEMFPASADQPTASNAEYLSESSDITGNESDDSQPPPATPPATRRRGFPTPSTSSSSLRLHTSPACFQ
jgi:hypothetical protein